MIKVLGIKIIDRIKEAGLTQAILSKHSAVIATRLGFHEVTDEICSREAYIILHLNGDPAESDALRIDLEGLGGVIIQEIVFNGDQQIKKSESESSPIEIMGMLVERDQDVIRSVQKILTSYGCNIRTRLGVNELFFGEPAGLIILELKGDPHQRLLLEQDLRSIERVHVMTMVF